MCKAKAAPTPQVAATEISRGQNLLAARDMLVRLGLLSVGDNEAFVTPQGEEIMRNQNLIDETGELTPEGQKYAGVGVVHKESLIQSLNKLTD